MSRPDKLAAYVSDDVGTAQKQCRILAEHGIKNIAIRSGGGPSFNRDYAQAIKALIIDEGFNLVSIAHKDVVEDALHTGAYLGSSFIAHPLESHLWHHYSSLLESFPFDIALLLALNDDISNRAVFTRSYDRYHNIYIMYDPTNFTDTNHIPHSRIWPHVQHRVKAINIKDKFKDGHFTAPGNGDSNLREIINDVEDCWFIIDPPQRRRYSSSVGPDDAYVAYVQAALDLWI